MALAQRINGNNSASMGNTSGKLSQKDIIPIQPVSQSTAADDNKAQIMQITAIPYATCSTASATATKQATMQNFPSDYSPVVGSKIKVKFTNANTATTQMYLKVGTLAAKPCTCRGIAMGAGSVLAGSKIEFMYDGEAWDCQLCEAISAMDTTSKSPINSTALNGALADLHKKLGEFAHSSSQSSEQFYVYKISGFQNIIGGNQSDMARITLQTRYTARLALNLIAYATAPTNCVKAELEDTNGVSNEKFEVKYDISNGKFDIYVKLTVGTFANRQVFFLENRTTGANNVTVTELTDDTSFVNAQYTCNVDEVITQKSLNDNLSDYQPYLHYYLNAGQEVDTGIFINQSLQSSKTYTRRKSFLVMLTSNNGYGDTTSERLCIIKIGRSRNVIEVFTIHESLISTSGYFFNDLEFVSSSDDITDNNNNTLIIRNKSTVNNHYVAIDFLL